METAMETMETINQEELKKTSTTAAITNNTQEDSPPQAIQQPFDQSNRHHPNATGETNANREESKKKTRNTQKMLIHQQMQPTKPSESTRMIRAQQIHRPTTPTMTKPPTLQ